MLTATSSAWAQGTPSPPPLVPMPTGLPMHSGWYVALMVGTVIVFVVWYGLTEDEPPGR